LSGERKRLKLNFKEESCERNLNAEKYLKQSHHYVPKKYPKSRNMKIENKLFPLTSGRQI